MLCSACVFATLQFAGCNPRDAGETVSVNGEVAKSDDPSLVQADQVALDSTNVVDELARASQAIERGELDVAEQSLKQCLLADPNSVVALELSADVAARRGNQGAAALMYEDAIDASGEKASRDLFDRWSKSLLRAGRPYDSIHALQKLSERYPNDVKSRYDIAGMAAAFGVPELAVPPLRWLVQRGQSDPETLLLLADPGRSEPDVESCQKLLGVSGMDRRAEYGLARLDAMNEKWDAVAKRLSPIVSQHPSFGEAHALYGQALFELGENEKLVSWKAAAPEQAADISRYWVTLGRWEQSRGNHASAAIAFGETLRRHGVIYPEVLPLLLTSVSQLQRNEDAAALSNLIIKQTKLRDALRIHLERSGESQTACMDVADAMADLGRIWEAECWGRLAVSLPNEKISDLRDRYMAIRNQLKEQTPWQLPELSAATLVDLSDLSEADGADVVAVATSTAVKQGQISFADEAESRGWVHTSIPQPKTGGYTIEQTVGGGIAVIDFDCDGWPDLAAAMLDGNALESNSSPNRLCRNLEGNFVDVSTFSGYQDRGFGQGIAVADYNHDGFPDLLDANIGRNRLYRNNGDGTFTDVSDMAGLAGEKWTTSAALVDLNGDGLLDLFEVTYCAGTAPFERECRHKFGIGTCSPLLFDAEPDRVWRGCEDGTFEDVTAKWMSQTTSGRGMGLVAGELDEHLGIDVLVANDMTVNHLWSSHPKSPSFGLQELGVIRGVGTSGKSHSQASMGIASGDADADGDLDFLMTHFSDDYNTFYEQVAPGFWMDRSYPCGFVESSLKLLGFGTQWIDFDNNGAVELIIANGHVDQLGRDDVAYRMPAQLYLRGANGRWDEQDRASLGDYFQHDHLGRALVRVDANRDGLIDVAVSHLGDPAALLVNRTSEGGRGIVLELTATSTPREAIGARVEFKLDSRRVLAHLTTGDGYMAANERRIHVGCGAAASVNDVTVFWPSGNVEKFGTLTTGREYLLIENSGEAFER